MPGRNQSVTEKDLYSQSGTQSQVFCGGGPGSCGSFRGNASFSYYTPNQPEDIAKLTKTNPGSMEEHVSGLVGGNYMWREMKTQNI